MNANLPIEALDVAVAMILFNRPETTEKVFAEVRRAKPARLLLVADGPRANRIGESERCQQARQVVDQIDWPCEVFRNYSSVNLGCRKRVSSGLDWVFDIVSEAIVLEDDCVPHPSFFRYCSELLHRYRDEPKVACISGDNSQGGRKHGQASYYFSRYPRVWGWASWRRAWKSYDVSLADWFDSRNRKAVLSQFGNLNERAYWRHNWDLTAEGKIDTWDYQWSFVCLATRSLTAIPNCNLISNIGMGSLATHTTKSNALGNLPLEPMRFPLAHPTKVERNVVADEYTRSTLLRFPGPGWGLGRKLDWIGRLVSGQRTKRPT